MHHFRIVLILPVLVFIIVSCGRDDMYSHFASKKGSGTTNAAIITVSPANTVISQGETRSFTATLSYPDGSTSDITTSAQWTVSGHATLSSGNSITAGSAGTAGVTASYNGISDTAEISVEPVTSIFISISTGNDSTGTGTSTNPYQTFAHALSQSPTKIYAAAGDYDIATPIALSTGISIYGGYSPSDWSRNIQQNITRISDISSTIGSSSSPASPICITGGSPELNGLFINGQSSGTYCAAVLITGGSPSINMCSMNSESGSLQTYGIKIHNSDVNIRDSVIKCGSAAGTFQNSWGIEFTSSSMHTLNLFNSTVSAIRGALETSTVRMTTTVSAALYMYNNLLTVKTSTGNTRGLILDGHIIGNTNNNTFIVSNTSPSGSSYGVFVLFNLPSSFIFDNNIIDASGNALAQYCIYNSYAYFMTECRSNLFYVSGASPYYFKDTSTVYSWTTAGTFFGFFGSSSGNISGDPLFASSGDYHLKDASPAKNAGLNGLTQSPAWPNFPVNASSQPIDLDQNIRPSGGWSIGAYQ